MRWQGMGALIVALAATGAHAQAPALAPLSAAVFDGGKALPTEWRSTEIVRSDTRLKISLGGAVLDERGLPALSPSDRDSFEPRGFDVQLTQSWPAVRLRGGERDIEVTPSTGIAFSEAGPGAQAGATISLQDRVADRLDRLGVKDGRSYGDKGRWYLYAATSGRSVGLNMLRGADGEFRREWSTDATSALVSDAQVGVGWRRGAVQTSVGYMHREIKPSHGGLRGLEHKDDDLIAVSFSFKPR